MPRTRSNAVEPFGERFTFFADCLYLGILTAVASLPFITWPAAFRAACVGIRRVAIGERLRITTYVGDVRPALTGGVVVALAGAGVAALLAVDLKVARSGLPGGTVFTGVALVGLALLAVGLVRISTVRVETSTWRDAVREGARRTVTDPLGSLLVAAALLIVVAVAWQLLILVPLTLGPLALAAVGIENRKGRP